MLGDDAGVAVWAGVSGSVDGEGVVIRLAARAHWPLLLLVVVSQGRDMPLGDHSRARRWCA